MAEPSSSSTAAIPTSSPSSSTHHQRVAGRELQGPRPAPLSVRRRDSSSHEKKKMRRKQQHPQQVRQPVIIYTVSPRVVHAEPREFMSVVQRLTGLPPPPPETTTTTIPSSFFSGHPAMAPQMQFPFQLQQQHHHQQQQAAGVISPAARPAAIHQQAARNATTVVVSADDVGGQLPPLPTSILSPVPGSLPAVPPSFFSPPAAGAGAAAAAGSGINLFGELISPAAAFPGATTSQFYPTTAPSPSGPYYWDLFNHHQQNNNL
ncbi:hypothetical protein QOZ80_8AG0614310 [Eleusine coracana subsp. coracana]|nr:hypothetical protein QOZ80_8AG0614310 [Eleusine coracana subsp. coracana]